MSAPVGEAARRAFIERGVLLLRGLIAAERVGAVRQEIYELLERHGAWRDGRWNAEACEPGRMQTLRRAIKDRMKQSGACAALETPELAAAVRELTSEPVSTLRDRPQVLFTPPGERAWAVPHRIWHLDVPRLRSAGCPGIQSFCCIDVVDPGGGGTVVVSGSHKLLNGEGRIASRDVKRRLAPQPWFRSLFSPGDDGRTDWLMSEQTVHDETGEAITLQVVELTGEPGDVYLVDLRTLHSLAPNTSARPRLAATQRFFRASVAEEVYAGSG